MQILNAKHKRRDQLCIVADILDIAKGPALKTQLMYKANLSFTQLNEYLSFLINNNLITQTIYDGREGYVVTEQGLGFLQKHSELIELLKTCGGIKKSAASQKNLTQIFSNAQAPKVIR